MKTSGSSAPLDCFLIADDLTGACDAAVHFAMRGRRTLVAVTPGAGVAEATVAAISTDSRDLEAAAARNAIANSAARLTDRSPAILFKKIDSTVRGHAAVEIEAALVAFGCDAAVVCPAFPQMNRIVEAGSLLVAGDPNFARIDMVAQFRSPGAECVHTGPAGAAAAIAAGARVVTLNAVCDDDLDRIAAAGLALDRRVLWAGSAGLAAALARTLPVAARPFPRPEPKGPVLFCIGSDHPVTVAQQTTLVCQRGVVLLRSGISGADIEAALGRGQHVMLRIPRGVSFARWLTVLVASVPGCALLLSGGYTASQLCRAAGVQWIDLFDEIIPGVPRGVIRGGDLDGVSVATKSGGFGGADALIQVADYFHA